MPTPAHNVLFLFVLPPAALDIADRIGTQLMILVEAVGLIITNRGGPLSPDHPAIALFFRLSTIVNTIIRLSLAGPRNPAAPKPATPAAADSAPRHAARIPTPRRPAGWMLDILPDIAPAVAADLAAILADPAFATLLAAAPTLDRRLRPLLRGLGLPSRPTPPADIPPSGATPSPITPRHEPTRALPTRPANPHRGAPSGRTENNPPYLGISHA